MQRTVMSITYSSDLPDPSQAGKLLGVIVGLAQEVEQAVKPHKEQIVAWKVDIGQRFGVPEAILEAALSVELCERRRLPLVARTHLQFDWLEGLIAVSKEPEHLRFEQGSGSTLRFSRPADMELANVADYIARRIVRRGKE